MGGNAGPGIARGHNLRSRGGARAGVLAAVGQWRLRLPGWAGWAWNIAQGHSRELSRVRFVAAWTRRNGGRAAALAHVSAPRLDATLYADRTDAAAAWFLAERLYRYTRDADGHWSARPKGDIELAGTPAQRLVALGSAASSQTLYLADDAGRIWRSLDGGQSFEARGTTLDLDRGHALVARCIQVDGAQLEHLWVAGTGYAGPECCVRSMGG